MTSTYGVVAVSWPSSRWVSGALWWTDRTSVDSPTYQRGAVASCGVTASVFSDHLTAWATAAAAVGTVLTLVFLASQLAIELAARRRRAKRGQAESISAWVGSDWLRPDPERTTQRIELLNASREPVYRVVALLVMLPRGPEDTSQMGRVAKNEYGGYFMSMLSVLPPGRHYTTVPPPPTMMFRRYGVQLAFTDRAGVHWLRTADGALTEIKQPAPDYYELPLPHDWATPVEVGGPDLEGD